MEAYYNTLNQKLDRLQEKQKRTTSHTPHGRQTYPRTVNLTNIQFTNEEQAILELGLQYSLQKSPASSWTTLALEMERAIKLLDNKIQNSFRILAVKQLKQLYNANHNKTMHKRQLYVLKQIRQKITQGNAMTACVDKEKTTVIIHTQDYTDKVYTFLTENNFRTLTNNPTHKDHKSIHKNLLKCDKIIDKKHIKYLTQKNSPPPTLNALLKLHKPNTPIRPAHKAAKKLNTILNNTCTLKTSTVINSSTLVKDLIQLKINNKHRLLTLDIQDLYVNIPIKETINITKTQLMMRNDKHTANQIIMLLETILGQNYFTFQNKIYQPDKGVAMGSPISGTVAEIFLQKLEKPHIKHLIDSKHLIFYVRYVDDIYDSTLTSPTNMQRYMDTIHGNIKLNTTHETNDKVKFLDLSIIRKLTSNANLLRWTPPSTFSPTTLSSISSRPIDSL